MSNILRKYQNLFIFQELCELAKEMALFQHISAFFTFLLHQNPSRNVCKCSSLFSCQRTLGGRPSYKQRMRSNLRLSNVSAFSSNIQCKSHHHYQETTATSLLVMHVSLPVLLVVLFCSVLLINLSINKAKKIKICVEQPTTNYLEIFSLHFRIDIFKKFKFITYFGSQTCSRLRFKIVCCLRF